MNKHEAKKYAEWIERNLPAIKAFGEGKPIQIKYGPEAIRPIGHSKEWNDADMILSVQWRDHEYRVKPDPRKVWVIYNKRGKVCTCSVNSESAEAIRAQYTSVAPHNAPFTVVEFEEKLK